MRSSALRKWIWLHKWSSLASMVFLLMLCLTGLPLIFHEEIEHWINPHPELEAVAPGTQAPPIESLVRRSLADRPDGFVVPYLFFPDDEPHAVGIATAETIKPPASGDWHALHFHVFDQRTGKLIAQQPNATSGFMYVMRRLHVDMFANLPGTLFLGVMGLLMVIAVISGVVVYAPFMRKLDFATVRRSRGPRVRWLDLHNLAGVVSVAWVCVVALTGFINTLSQPLTSIWQSTELAQMTAPYDNAPPLQQRIAVDVAIATARAAAPGMTLSWINFPGSVFNSPHHYAAFFMGNTPLTSKLLRPVLVDAQTGQLTDARDMPWYIQTLGLSRPLHFGDYGGLPLKIIWALLTLLTLLVLASGIYLWLRKPGAHAAPPSPGKVL